jgi:hypothetical protein
MFMSTFMFMSMRLTMAMSMVAVFPVFGNAQMGTFQHVTHKRGVKNSPFSFPKEEEKKQCL